MVKKGYRDPPYHNWSHAFSVAHFNYTLFKNCDGLSILTDLEVLALFISCLCHDIDHRGTNNAFQVSSVSGRGCGWSNDSLTLQLSNLLNTNFLLLQNSVLASLYSSEGSVMEVLCVLYSYTEFHSHTHTHTHTLCSDITLLKHCAFSTPKAAMCLSTSLLPATRPSWISSSKTS